VLEPKARQKNLGKKDPNGWDVELSEKNRGGDGGCSRRNLFGRKKKQKGDDPGKKTKTCTGKGSTKKKELGN